MYKYKNVRVVCSGKVKGCPECKDIEFSEGYCKYCRRPLWKKIGDNCREIIGYHDGDFQKRGKVHIKCFYCNTIITI